MNITEREFFTPLTPQALHVLLALAKSQNDGYGVMKMVREDTHGSIKLSSGTTYPLLRRMLSYGFIKELEPSQGSGPHGINRVYRLTDNGRDALISELDRVAVGLELGRKRIFGVQ